MILTGKEHIHENMMLNVGDKFHARINRHSPNVTSKMIRDSGKWFTVRERSSHRSKHFSGYYYKAINNPFNWYWFHIDAIEIVGNVPVQTLKKSGELPLI